jgi:hypothetical protein
MRRIVRAFPTLLRIGFAEAVAYRAEFVIWMLTTTMPLVMLALWTAVAREGPFGRFTQADFVAYYLAALIVRTLSSSWGRLGDEPGDPHGDAVAAAGAPHAPVRLLHRLAPGRHPAARRGGRCPSPSSSSSPSETTSRATRWSSRSCRWWC